MARRVRGQTIKYSLPDQVKVDTDEKERKYKRKKYREKVQERGGNVIYADEWDKIDSGLKKGIGLKGGGRAGFSEGGGKDSGKTGEAKSKAVLQNMKLERKFPKTSKLLKKAGVIKKASGGRIGYKVGGAAKRGVSNILRKK
jgi:hypothetical protein